MSEPIDVDKIHLRIDEIKFGMGKNSCGGIKILWSADIGFGEYQLNLNDDGSIEGDSEAMDTNQEKSFLRKLLQLLADKTKIE